MTPLQFETCYEPLWTEFETQLATMRKSARVVAAQKLGPLLAENYRRCCEHLALAQSRDYPAALVERLERLTSEGHQFIYQQRVWGVAKLGLLFRRDFPRAVRAHARYVWISAAVLMLPTLIMAFVVAHRPELITTVVSPEVAAQYEEMYSTSADSVGRTRNADTDWQMFGFYIRNNITVSFQCFAGGIFFGIGSLFFLFHNGLFGGVVAGYLWERGLSGVFFPFVATHSAFELTAIILSGAAGLRLGHSLLAPGRESRSQALVRAGRESVVVIYGVIAMLLIAAAIEAFWSSSVWLPPAAKYGGAGLAWLAVLTYLFRQGRHAD